MRFAYTSLFVIFAACIVNAQLPLAANVVILKAEDERRYDQAIERLFASANEAVKIRAVLAAGRIGDDRAVVKLIPMLKSGSDDLRSMTAFALGEIESIKAANAILVALRSAQTPDAVRARAVEAAGKMAAANPGETVSTDLGNAILDTLEAEDRRGTKQDRMTILLGLTAALRARPEETDFVAAKFLTSLDARIRADAANTLARIKAKNANAALRAMLLAESDGVARSAAARALGAADDKEAANLLLVAAVEDDDARVRVSAVRSLGLIKVVATADKLISRAESLLAQIKSAPRPELAPQKSEFLEIAVALGSIIANSRNERAVNALREFGKIDRGASPEAYIARFRIAPDRGDNGGSMTLTGWQQYSTLAQTIGELATAPASSDEVKKMKTEAPEKLRPLVAALIADVAVGEEKLLPAAPDVLRAYAKFNTADLSQILREALKSKDVFVRTAAAELIADQPQAPENLEALRRGFVGALETDLVYNDAQLAMLDALFKLDKTASVSTLIAALDAPDYLIRKKAITLLSDKELQQNSADAAAALAAARARQKDRVLPYRAASGTKLGQVLNTTADYRRAALRRNGQIAAVVATAKGKFTIELMPEDAPLTVDNFVRLAQAGYFDGLAVHRVVPNFVMQDGDPRGDGNGGPGWSIRCEINMIPYGRGAVGMALSGKDTGGSQWFVTHSPQPHLDGGYTVFGTVNEAGMKVVDNIVRGDKITSITVIKNSFQSNQRRR